MSNPVRIGLVAEGWTDRHVVEAAIAALLGARPYALKLLQPEDPLRTAPFGGTRPGGWPGVYRWCREAVGRSNQLSADVQLLAYDIVILHLDADVADCDYAGAHIQDAPDPADLPCVHPVCPPPGNTTDPLRVVLLRWAGEAAVPPRVILCTPSKSTETWVLAGLYSGDAAVTSDSLECVDTAENFLKIKPLKERLFRSGKKVPKLYETRKPDLILAWPQIRSRCEEAERFSIDFLSAVSP